MKSSNMGEVTSQLRQERQIGPLRWVFLTLLLGSFKNTIANYQELYHICHSKPALSVNKHQRTMEYNRNTDFLIGQTEDC